jgi:hypothetical protein
MGIATQKVIEGDIICIPLGCCHPIILRRVKDHYINLGEGFVDGYMYGEAMDLLERGELKLGVQTALNTEKVQIWPSLDTNAELYGKKQLPTSRKGVISTDFYSIYLRTRPRYLERALVPLLPTERTERQTSLPEDAN